MNVLIPSTRHPRYTYGEIVYLNEDDDTSYWQFWDHVWSQKKTVIVVEHDIMPSTIALKSMWLCPHGWCTQPYNYLRIPEYRGLGCVKFSGTLMTAFPNLWKQVAAKSDYDHPQKHWCRLDAWSAEVLTNNRIMRHDHGLQVNHSLKEKSSHGCV